MAAPLAEVDDPRRHSIWMEADAQDVRRRLEQRRRDPLEQGADGVVGGEQVPVPLDDDRRIRLMGGRTCSIASRTGAISSASSDRSA
jgi:hypothetical protein